MRPHCRLLFASCLAAVAGAAAAGTVDVTFVNAPAFQDAGNYTSDEPVNLQALAAHLQGLGQRLLPANQSLKVEVLDVDLAGTVRQSPRTGANIRVLRGGADWPRIHLRFALEADGKPLRSGDEWVSDMTYAQGPSGYRDSQALYYEKRMLGNWFKQRFTAPG